MTPKDENQHNHMDVQAPVVSTEFDPDTGRKVKKAALIFVVVLAFGFVAVRVDQLRGGAWDPLEEAQACSRGFDEA